MTTPINPLPTPPSPADSPVDFNTKAFALLGALPAFVTEANAQASGLDAAVAAAELEADAAALKAGEALALANNAAISKTGADSARDDAVIAKNSAEAALDSFAARYLGAKAVAPTTDNDGAALLPGALYWDTVIGAMRAWSGSVWVTLPATTAAAISNTPAGSISATTVQAAINELDSEKVAKTDVIAIAKGGTGATSANAAADAIGAFRRGTLLGAVSQSAGVPTGALLESGTSATGAYWRFASGLQIATGTAPTVTASGAFGAVFGSAGVTATYAAAFSSPPKVAPTAVTSTGWALALADNNTFVTLYGVSPLSGSSITPQYIAVGFWF